MDSSDKTSRSGRQVKIPSKFMDMEVEDSAGRRAVSVSSPAVAKPKSEATPGTGKKRGRPPRQRNSLSLTSEASVTVDGNASAVQPTSRSAFDDLIRAAEQVESQTPAAGTSVIPSKAELNTIPEKQTDPGRKSPAPSEAGSETSTASTVSAASSSLEKLKKPRPSIAPASLREERPKRIRKKPISPDEIHPAPKRRKGAGRGRYDDIEIPQEMIDDMRTNRQVTAYSIFCREMRPVVQQEQPGGDFSFYSKALGNRWNQLTDGEKNKWKRMAAKISAIIEAERGPNAILEATQSRRARDKLLRDVETRIRDPPTSAPFDLISQVKMIGSQMTSIGDALSAWSNTTDKAEYQDPAGCVDALLDCSFAVIASTFSIVAQLPVFQEAVDKETIDDLVQTVQPILESTFVSPRS